MNELNQTKYLTQKEVSKILNIQVATLNQWRCCQKYKMPYVKLGRVILYPSIEFYEWLESYGKNIQGGFNNE